VSKSKTRLVADFLGKVQANTTTGEAEQGDLRNVVGDAPGTLDTLDEIAAAIGDDANFATTVNNALATKLEDITAESIEDLSDVTVPVEGQALGAVPKYTGTGYEISKVTTDEVVEEAGASNLFYTDARAQAAISTDATLSYTNGEVSMPATGVTANTYGSASEVPVLTVDEQGRVTAATTTSVAGVSSFTWDNANNTLNISTADGGSFSADITSISTNVIAALTDSAPGALDTLNELAAAIGDDADFAGTITNALSNKVDKINITGNSFGSANAIPSIIYNDQGQITSASSTAIGGSVTGPFNDLGMQYGVNYSGTPRQGSFFFDSLNQKMMVNTGSAWVDAVPAGTGTSGGESTTTDANATFDQYTFTVSTSTNTVTGTDDAGTTFAYDTNADVVVYVNGVKQLYGASNDYVATNGTSVNFVQNLIAGDVVDVQVYNLLTNDAFYLKTETFTQTETNAQISNAVANYLPLGGGDVIGSLTVRNSDYENGLKINRNLDVATVGAAGVKLRFGAYNNGSPVYPIEFMGVVDTDGTAQRMGVLLDSSEKLTIKSSGNVGIGTDNPSAGLHLDTSTGKMILERSGTAYDGSFSLTAGGLDGGGFRIRDEAAGSYRLTVESSGNLLVGTTFTPSQLTSTSTTSGFGYEASSGYLALSRAGTTVPAQPTLHLNRSGTDGDILSLKKNGSTVGSIGVNGRPYIEATGTDTSLMVAFNGILPKGAGAATRTGEITLGSENDKFKDLYLSGISYSSSVVTSKIDVNYFKAGFAAGTINNTTDANLLVNITDTFSQGTQGVIDIFLNSYTGQGYCKLHFGVKYLSYTPSWNILISSDLSDYYARVGLKLCTISYNSKDYLALVKYNAGGTGNVTITGTVAGPYEDGFTTVASGNFTIVTEHVVLI